MVLKVKVRLGVTGAIVLALLLGACAPSDNVGEPVLSNTLIRGCERTMPSGGFENVGLAVGETAIDFTLKDVYGNIVRLASLLGEKPVVMIFGSFTCPPFRQRCAVTDTLATTYGSQVHFIIIHAREAHAIDTGRPSPFTYDEEGNPIYEPRTYEERVELARSTVAAEGITVPVLVDEMDNPLWCTYGPAPDIAYLIGTDGKIVEKQGWYDPEQMESAILAYTSLQK